MRRLLVSSFVLTLAAGMLAAQDPIIETVTLTAPLSSSNEVPPITDLDAGGDATIRIHTQRASDGVLEGATVEFRLDYLLGAEQMISAMHIHRGAAGQNGAVVVDSEFGDPVTAGPGEGSELRQVTTTDPSVLSIIEEILADPSGFYVNVHSGQFPDGFARGQLEPAMQSELELLQELQSGQAALAGQLDTMQELLERIAVRSGVLPNPPEEEPPPVGEPPVEEPPPAEEPPVEEPPPGEEPPAEEPPPGEEPPPTP